MSDFDQRIYLASSSPRRRELLRQIGVQFDLLLLRSDLRRGVDVDESTRTGELPIDYVTRLAREKALTAQTMATKRRLRLRPVLSADTTVVLDGCIMGKPADEEEALAMLRRLSERRHGVLTALAICQGAIMETALSESTVDFGAVGENELRRYVASGEPFGKAGSYGVQGRAAAFIRQLSGSYSGVMGLPLHETAVLLRKFGLQIP